MMSHVDVDLLGWCVVANVVAVDGPDGQRSGRTGTPHFWAGTKVWVLPPQWGDGGEKVFVVGRHRGRPGGVVRMVIGRRALTSFRVRGVYSPTVWRELVRPWRQDVPTARVWQSREETEQFAAYWNEVIGTDTGEASSSEGSAERPVDPRRHEPDDEPAVSTPVVERYLDDVVRTVRVRLEAHESLESIAGWLLTGPTPWPIGAIKVLWEAGTSLSDAKTAVDSALAVTDPRQVSAARALREDLWLAWVALPPDLG
jgi:hypothetical protein